MENLRRLRRERCITQMELCNELGMKQVTYSSYETGKRDLPIKKAKRIADVFGVNWWELYD